MDKFFENLKREAEENPLMAMGVGVGLLTAAGKFIEAAGSVRSKRAYAKKFGDNPKKSKK